jgi:DNA-binding GntR family transcriptional regulator
LSSTLPTVGRVALADHVRIAIYDNLLNLTIAPGGRINIDGVARELQVSPTPVREALARLEAEELVVKRPMAGYLAAPLLEAAALADLLELRLQVEPWLAQLAARADRSARIQLRELVSRSGQPPAPTPAAAAAADRELHDRIALLAGNASAHQMLQRLNAQFHVYRFHATRAAIPDPRAEHAAVAQAIAAGDGKAAQERMRRHLSQARDRVLAADS